MIELFKIIHNMTLKPSSCRRYTTTELNRGNMYRLLGESFHYDVRNYSFTARVVNILQ